MFSGLTMKTDCGGAGDHAVRLSMYRERSLKCEIVQKGCNLIGVNLEPTQFPGSKS